MFNIIKHWFLYKTKGWMKAPDMTRILGPADLEVTFSAWSISSFYFISADMWSWVFFYFSSFYFMSADMWVFFYFSVFFFSLYQCWYVSFLLPPDLWHPFHVGSWWTFTTTRPDAGSVLIFNQNHENVTFLLQIVSDICFLCHGDYFAMWFGGSLPRLISINPTPPPLAPHQWKNPIYPTKRGLASLAHIIVRNWPQPSSSSSPMVILKIQIHESNDEFLWTKNNFAIFQAVISNMKVTLSLSPSLRWINLKTKMILIKLMC